MIQIESVNINGRMLIHTYSDDKRYVVRDNIPYIEAYDPPQFNRTYTEGEKIPPEVLPPEEQESQPTAEEVLSILLGSDET